MNLKYNNNNNNKALVPDLVNSLAKLGRPDVMIICGGVIPPQDYDFLYKHGVGAIFGPGTKLPVAALEVIVVKSNSHNIVLILFHFLLGCKLD